MARTRYGIGRVGTTIRFRTQELADADRRKDHFLAVLAHELRNPLAPLSHALDVWPTAAQDPQRLEELRQLMTSQVSHMTGLIDDLLDVSRIAVARSCSAKKLSTCVK